MSQSRAAKHLADYQPSAWQVESLSLRFELDFAQALVHAEFVVVGTRSGTLLLHGQGLSLLELRVDGVLQELTSVIQAEDGIELQIPGTQARINSVVRIAPEHNDALEGLYRSGEFLLTQCEAEGFRRITYFLDRPDVMTTYKVRLEAEQSRFPVLLSNGNRTAQGELPDGRHFAEYFDPWPKPSYLFALCAGRLEHIAAQFRTSEGRDVALRIYAEPGAIERCDFAMQALQRCMRWDEQRFGLNYDLDEFNIVATNDFNMGAMENKSLNIFNAKNIVAEAQSATDRDFQLVEAIIAHEYFHNFTGNRVTCRDWFQLSLKEGLTVFRDQEFTAEHGMAAIKRIEDVKLLRAVQFAEDAGPLSHPVRPQSYVEINNFYTSTVYDKGAEVVRLYQTLLGREVFVRGVQLYLRKHDGQAATVEDFLNAMCAVSGRDLSPIMRWYSQAGTPHLRIRASYQADTQSCVLELQQHTPATPGQADKQPLLIPIAIALLDASGAKQRFSIDGGPVADSHVLEFDSAEQRVTLTGVHANPVLSLLRGFSAPVKLEFAYSSAHLQILLQHEDDAYVRFDAAERLHLGQLLRLSEDALQARSLSVDAGYLAAFKNLLQSSAAAPALKAKLLALPEETELAEHVAQIHVGALHSARAFLLHTLGSHLAEELHALSQPLAKDLRYEPSPEQIGARALRNLALDLLQSGSSLSEQAMWDGYQQANNMTDRFAALRRLAHSNYPRADDALTHFAERYADQPLVLDKWFAVQATRADAGTLQRVQLLSQHKHFDVRNPNKVRALWLQFSRNNPVGFHSNPAAHQYLAERIVALDSANPQIAARLSQALAGWRRYEPSVRDSMQAALRFVQQQPELSADLSELVGKALA